MPLPALAVAGIISSGIQAAKGISEIVAAKRQRQDAMRMKAAGEAEMKSALANRKAYTVSDALNQSKTLALNQYYDNSAARNAAAIGDRYAATAASRAKRGAATSSDVASSAFLAEQMANDAALRGEAMGIENRASSLAAVMNANAGIANEEARAYEYNEMVPFRLNYEMGRDKFGAGLQGSIDARNRMSAAFGGIGDGLTNAAMTAGYAIDEYGMGGGTQKPVNPSTRSQAKAMRNWNNMRMGLMSQGIGFRG